MLDNENNALSDCAWWDVPPANRPWWAKGDCSGVLLDTNVGLICEAHVNASNTVDNSIKSLPQ